MVNRVYLLGRLGKDPQIRSFSNDNSIAEFSLATSEVYKDKEGKFNEVTDWHNIKIPYKAMAERAEKLLKKGSLVFIEGKIKTRSYDDKDGNKRYVTEVVVDSFKPLDKRENSDQSSPESYGENSDQSGQSASSSDIEGDLPF